MKQKKLIGIGAICLTLIAMTVIGIGLSNRDTNIELTKSEMDLLKDTYNIEVLDIEFLDHGCDDTECKFYASTPNGSLLNGEYFTVPRYKNASLEYSDDEKVDMRDKWGQNRLKGIAEAADLRQNPPARDYKDIGGTGTIEEEK